MKLAWQVGSRPALSASLMGGVVVGCGAILDLPPLLDVAIRVPVGAVAYVLFSLWINGEHIRQVVQLLRARDDTPSGNEKSSAA